MYTKILSKPTFESLDSCGSIHKLNQIMKPALMSSRCRFVYKENRNKYINLHDKTGSSPRDPMPSSSFHADIGKQGLPFGCIRPIPLYANAAL